MSSSEPRGEADGLGDLLVTISDPVERMLLTGQAETVGEAEERYLDSCLPDAVRLLQSGATDEELARHPLMVMLRTHGSRGWEDSVE